jgi:predicted TPR repeat methyltransferase
MVAKAQERGCYDVLAVDELVNYLEGAAAAVEQQGRREASLLLLLAAEVVRLSGCQPVI